jgi:hypothetical protein
MKIKRCLSAVAVSAMILLYAHMPVSVVCAQVREIVQPENYWGNIGLFLDKEAEVALKLVTETLDRYPPGIPEPAERRMALVMLDGVLHEEKAPARPSVQAFYHSRMERAVRELEQTKVKEGAVIYKLYDLGFVVRTPSVTLSFDVIRGYSSGAEGFAVSDELMSRLARQCDALFISHRHADHADEWVASAFIEAGKPVVAPPDLWEDRPFYQRIRHLTPKEHLMQELPVRDGAAPLKVVIYPGHQGKIPNNFTVVFTPEGMSFCQTGDQSNDADFSWIDRVREHCRVDVLMPNCWTTDIVRVTDGIDPAVVITGHENELGHSIDHREPYWLTWRRYEKGRRPLVLMTWGESFRYKGGQSP